MFDTLYNRRNILVKIRPCGGSLIELQTYDRIHGRSRRFLISRNLLANHDFSNGAFYDGDCGNVLTIKFVPHSYRLCCEILWLNDMGNDVLSGTRQTFSFNPGLGILENMVEGNGGTYLYKGCHPENCSVKFSESAMRNIKGLMADKYARRAFSKAMRKSFQWPDTQTTLYADGSRDFYFSTNDGFCGGLIRHESGGKIYYSVHT